MSHFSVLVATQDKSLSETLLPYHEHECTGIDEYCQWVDDIQDEHYERYTTETTEYVIDCDGIRIGAKHDTKNSLIKSMWKTVKSDDDPFPRQEFVLDIGYDVVDVPFTEVYPTFDEFMEKYCGYTDKNPATGRFERWTNPNKKWDWYTVGGRFGQSLKLYNGKEVDLATASDVNWNAMFDERKAHLEKQYDSFHHSYSNATISEEKRYNYTDWCNRYDKVIEVFPTFEDFARADFAFTKINWHMWSLSDAIDILKSPKEKYSTPGALTFAFIDLQGEWKQEAEMGWWGMSDSSKGTDGYDGEWWEFVQNLPGDAVVYIVDCHI